MAREPITAPVTLAVLDTAKGGGGVAFVEVRIKSNPPVSWEEENLLGIGTDTADGGFRSGAAAPSVEDEQTMSGYLDALNAFELPNGKGPNVCVVGGAAGGVVDRVLFSIGYDGGYPTFVGRDAHGDIASVVSFLYLLPWSYSGLPGKAPAFKTAGRSSGVISPAQRQHAEPQTAMAVSWTTGAQYPTHRAWRRGNQ